MKQQETKKVMDSLRKQTIGRQFSFDEFMKITNTSGEDALILRERMFMDCYLEPKGDMLDVVHGKERKKLIEKKIKICSEKINEWYRLHGYLKKLK